MTEPAAAPAAPAVLPPVEFMGETFKSNQDIAESALMDFALDVTSHGEMNLLEQLSTLLRFALETIDPADRSRFRSTFRSKRGTHEDLMPVTMRVFGVVGATLPTGESSDSSDGLETTPQSSELSAAAKATALFPGRPDKAIALLRSVG